MRHVFFALSMLCWGVAIVLTLISMFGTQPGENNSNLMGISHIFGIFGIIFTVAMIVKDKYFSTPKWVKDSFTEMDKPGYKEKTLVKLIDSGKLTIVKKSATTENIETV